MMKWTGLNELRDKFLSFFESKGHLRLESFSLIPRDDDSLLLINSGMAPLKKYFMCEVTPPRKRVTTCQKCIRTPDIERVGITARHGTYFEMLGNFSFGDYFKHEATSWAWEFCTKVLNLPIDRLWISIYEEDDETFDIWTKEVGVSPNRIVRLGKEDNFWEHGSGPCGPCSEIYFDRGEEFGCSSPNCAVGCDCDRYVEFWNLVFTQFDNDGENNYTRLKNPNIDTGMGLERLACIMQGVDNLFLVDTVQNIMSHVSKISGVKYGESEKSDISLRVITDHIRSATFMISDGVMPSNEGRGYVLRRLIRRASRHGKLLGVNKPFLFEVCDTVINENKSAYPQLWGKKEFIKKLLLVEEEGFAKTIDQGLQMLNSIINNANIKILSGEDAFKLNDTFGFPLDLTKEIIAEKGIIVNEDRFKELLNEQKKRARAARKSACENAWKTDKIDFSSLPPTNFMGYTNMSCNSKVLGIIKDNEFVSNAFKEDKVILILDKTPFYAESGGQVGDSGELNSSNVHINVVNTTKSPSNVYLHSVEVMDGIISCGDEINCTIDKQRHFKIMSNHTAAHLLQAALRKVLGNHVEQAGQMVSDSLVRFDFTHFSALTNEELLKIENLINEKILQGIKVESREMPLEEAKELNAMALFGEKYGGIVRVVSVEDFSIEFCGGTHVDNTSKIGLFKIISESSVASGVRRIEAVTGEGVLKLLNEKLSQINECASILKLHNSSELVKRCSILMDDLKEKDKTINTLNNKFADITIENIISSAEILCELKVVKHNFYPELKNITPNELKLMCEKMNDRYTDSIAVFSGVNNGKALIIASAGKFARDKGVHAGNIVKEVAKLAGGNGGGKPDIAMAGAKDASMFEHALANVNKVIEKMISE